MEASNNKDNVVQLLQTLERRIAQQDKCFNQVNERLEQMEKRIELWTMNSHITDGRLYHIPLPNGDEVPEDQLPATQADFFNLTDQAIMNLIKQYGLEGPDGVPEATEAKRKILAEHLGIIW